MATTPVEVSLPSGETGLTLDLYPLDSTTADASGLSLSEETNALGFYRAGVTGAVSGLKRALVKDSGGGYFATTYIYLEDDTSVWREISQSEVGLWRESRPLALTSQKVQSQAQNMRGTDNALLASTWNSVMGGITSLAEWLGLLAGKQTGNSTARTEIRATGAGSGTYDETTDSQEAIRDRGDSAWVTATGFSTHSAADVWTVGSRTLTAFGLSVTVGTNNDKTGYSLNMAQTLPVTPTDGTVGDALSRAEAGIDAILTDLTDGTVVVGTLNDKTGMKLASDGLAQIVPSEPGSVPTYGTDDLPTLIAWNAAFYINKLTQDASTQTLRNNADTGNLGTASVSDDGTTYTRGAYS